METEARSAPAQGIVSRRAVLALATLLPLLLLAAMIFSVVARGIALPGAPVPVQDVFVEQVRFLDDERILMQLRNTGPGSVQPAQVLINEAIVSFDVQPAVVGRLASARMTIPYHWVPGEPYEFTLITADGNKFEHSEEFAVSAPQLGWDTLGRFGLLGVYVGVIPVFLGLCWYPLIRQLSRRWFHALLALTAGLLAFLLVDTLEEGLELALELPAVFNGTAVLLMATAASYAAVAAGGRLLAGGSGSAGGRALSLAYLIALGIGLHNLGEGLAIGAAYAAGEAAVGALLVLGFMIHNTTEGPAIVAPAAREGIAPIHFVLLGLIGGAPTVLGSWIGGLTAVPVLSVLFFGIGAGAIAQVVVEVVRLIAGRERAALLQAHNVLAFAAGVLIMYLTGLLVA